jgi:long-chain fatty acid transport protein
LEDGDVTWNWFDTPVKTFVEQNINYEKVDAKLNFPGFFTAGIYYKFTDKIGAEFDFQWFNWSIFDTLTFEFKDSGGDVVQTQKLPEDYENTYILRFGLHYDFTPELQLRLGYIRDETPQPIHSVSPLLPDNDRNDYSIGLGYTHNNMQFDMGYMMVDFGERSTVENGVGKNENGFDGTYSSLAHLFFVSFGINLN